MRVHGTLTKWNDERGFGFITSAQGTGEVFVHVSAFLQGSARPQPNELVSYETEAGPNGKLRAVRVMRPGERQPIRRVSQRKPYRSRRGFNDKVAALVALAAIGAYGYSKFQVSALEAASAFVGISTPALQSEASASFQCDGRTICSQMTSCAEAEFFLKHCPNTTMDGDHDGIPCEQQWCSQ